MISLLKLSGTLSFLQRPHQCVFTANTHAHTGSPPFPPHTHAHAFLHLPTNTYLFVRIDFPSKSVIFVDVILFHPVLCLFLMPGKKEIMFIPLCHTGFWTDFSPLLINQTIPLHLTAFPCKIWDLFAQAEEKAKVIKSTTERVGLFLQKQA